MYEQSYKHFISFFISERYMRSFLFLFFLFSLFTKLYIQRGGGTGFLNVCFFFHGPYILITCICFYFSYFILFLQKSSSINRVSKSKPANGQYNHLDIHRFQHLVIPVFILINRAYYNTIGIVFTLPVVKKKISASGGTPLYVLSRTPVPTPP